MKTNQPTTSTEEYPLLIDYVEHDPLGPSVDQKRFEQDIKQLIHSRERKLLQRIREEVIRDHPLGIDGNPGFYEAMDFVETKLATIEEELD